MVLDNDRMSLELGLGWHFDEFVVEVGVMIELVLDLVLGRVSISMGDVCMMFE